MSWSCDWDGPSVYDEEERVARKEYGCVECSAPILQGERHLVYRGMWDGTWGGGRQHLLCRDCCVWVRDQLNGECIAFGGLSEYWENVRQSSDCPPGYREYEKNPKLWDERFRIGARIYAMIRRRERLSPRPPEREREP